MIIMNQEYFTYKKNKLICFLKESLDQEKNKKDSLIKLLAILDNYTFKNRLEIKGTLSHTVVDSLEIDFSLGEKIINFDNEIS